MLITSSIEYQNGKQKKSLAKISLKLNINLFYKLHCAADCINDALNGLNTTVVIETKNTSNSQYDL